MESLDRQRQPDQATVNPETASPWSIGVATITFFPGWYPGEVVAGTDLTSKIRGDISIQTLREAKERGFQVFVVDGGSSSPFIDELIKAGVVVQPQQEKGYSIGRQESYRGAGSLSGVKAIFSTEAEKFSVIHDCLSDDVLKPVLTGEADVIVLKRDRDAFSTYPPEQAEYEQRANRLWNGIMKKHGLLSEDEEDLDIWFGPRVFRNDPKVMDVFMQNYEFEKITGNKLDQITDPSIWANFLSFPIATALKKGLTVKSAIVAYRHPPEQTSMESNVPEFERKRDVQYKNIIRSTMQFVRYLENNPRSRLRKVG